MTLGDDTCGNYSCSYVLPGIKPGWATYKANALLAVLSLSPSIVYPYPFYWDHFRQLLFILDSSSTSFLSVMWMLPGDSALLLQKKKCWQILTASAYLPQTWTEWERNSAFWVLDTRWEEKLNNLVGVYWIIMTNESCVLDIQSFKTNYVTRFNLSPPVFLGSFSYLIPPAPNCHLDEYLLSLAIKVWVCQVAFLTPPPPREGNSLTQHLLKQSPDRRKHPHSTMSTMLKVRLHCTGWCASGN